MSTRFVFVSFLGLGWAFYELSGGASYQPRPNPQVAARGEPPQTIEAAPIVKTAQAVPQSKEIVPALPPARPAANPALRQQVARNQLSQIGRVLNSASAFDNRIQTGSLQLVSLEGGLSAIESRPQTPAVDTANHIETPRADVRFVHASRVNLRQGPGTDYAVLSRLLADDKVVVVEDNGTGWLRLRVEKDGSVGWIAASLVSKKAP